MFNLKTGDVVLVEGTGIYGFIIRFGNWYSNFFKKDKATKYGHAGIMVDSTHIVEALSKGAVQRNFPYTKGFDIFRKKELTDSESEKLRLKALAQVGEKYSWYLIVVLGVLKILRLEWAIHGVKRKGEICSVLVAKCYREIDYSFSDIENIDFVDPMDIAEKIIYKDAENWGKIGEK